MPNASVDTLRRLRNLLLAVLTLGITGTGIDLLALGHYEDSWQLAPLVIVGLALCTIVWHALQRESLGSIRALRIVMTAALVAGVLGFLLHYQSNLEFQLEMDATQGHWSLLGKVLRAQAPPAFAPLSMVVFGLLGLVYTFRLRSDVHD